MSEFDYKYSFVDKELEMLQLWETEKTFEKLRRKNAENPKFRLIDGPITANNPMGIHHAWGRTLKDTFLRYKALQGFSAQYRNGFDSQGLWVEVEVEKSLNFKSKKDIESFGLDRFTDKCIDRVKEYSDIITQQSIRLGQWMDWENSYYTNSDENIAAIWNFLKTCEDNGWLSQYEKPVPWCPRCSTSMSEHEMTSSYREIEHTAVFVKARLLEMEAEVLVWTTTPWTLTANVALAVNPELDYVSAKLDGESLPLIMGKTYFTQKYAKKENVQHIVLKGSELVGMHFAPFFPDIPLQENVDHFVVAWEDVLDDEGSGVVHIAPGCGVEDYELGQQNNLKILSPIDQSGSFLPATGFLAGKSAQEANQEIFDYLSQNGRLFYTHPYTHSYPVCWRCKTPVLFKFEKEWAILVDELRPRLINNANKVKWNPPYLGKRMLDWLTNMSDWSISRKRYYGLPLPFYPCEHCGGLTVVDSKETLIEKAVDQKLAGEIPHLHRPWIDDILIRCDHCGKPVKRIPEVGDVWLDAGIVPFSTLHYHDDNETWKQYFPAEYVVEMKEQIRLWFYSMLFMSTVLLDQPPYQQVGAHGAVIAEDGSKFSKTGFMIRFDDAVEKLGADAIRYLFCSSPMNTDVRFGFNLGEVAKRKILSYWSLSTFFATYAHIDQPRIKNQKLDLSELNLVDQWLVSIVDEFVRTAKKAYDQYTTMDIITSFESLVDNISNFYIRANRRRFWTDNSSKDVAYRVLFYAIKTITQVMSPIIPFITEYVWQNVMLRYGLDLEESVHLSAWPEAVNDVDQSGLEQISYARDVISLAHFLRNQVQIRIRQPLSKLYLVDGSQSGEMSGELVQVIKNEINVKEIVFLPQKSELMEEYLVLNFKEAGGVLRGDVNKVKELLSELSPDQMRRCVEQAKSGPEIDMPGYGSPVPSHIFVVEVKPREGVVFGEEGSLFLALDLELTEELKQEGVLRDILRQCQVCRKNADFELNEHIYVSMQSDQKNLVEAVEKNLAFFESELLAQYKPQPLADCDYQSTFAVDGCSVKIQMKKQKV